MKNIKSYKQYIDRCEVVSFDVFDTLIKRNVRTPKDVFSLVEREAVKRFGVSMEGFRDKRVYAERTARELSDREEISFGEIYDRLPYEEEIKSSLSRMELEMEYALATVNQEIKEVYKYAIDRGKEVIIVSDMYLDRAFIERLLLKCGYSQYKKIYVSSETGVQKYTGNMYKMILRENSCSPGKIVHIGDALLSDYIRPKLFGIRSVHIPREINHTLYCRKLRPGNLDSDSLYSFINNTVSGADDRLFRIGYETLGPLLYGFCVWLHEEKTKLGINKLLFLSRDGQIIHKAYQQLYPEDSTGYVYVSRRGVTVPFIHLCRGLEEMLDKLPVYRYTSVATMLEIMGLNYMDYKDQLKELGLDADASFTKEQYLTDERLRKLFVILKPEIDQNSRDEYSSFMAYVQNWKLEGKVGIVDVGWVGRIQMALDDILPLINPTLAIYGFYFGTSLRRGNAFGYLYDLEHKEKKVPLNGFLGLFETLFSANHGSLKRYRPDITVELYDFEYGRDEMLQNTYKEIVELQRGSLSFIEKFSSSPVSSVIEWNPELSSYGIFHLGLNPCHKDLRKMGNWPRFNNNELDYLARPSWKSYCYLSYLRRELANAPWKIGYIKRFLKIPVSPLKVYGWLLRSISDR